MDNSFLEGACLEFELEIKYELDLFQVQEF